MDDPDNYYVRFTCDAPLNYNKYCNQEFDKLFAQQSRTFDVQQRAEITRQMERMLLQDIPSDRGFYWKSAMAYWNRVKQCHRCRVPLCTTLVSLSRCGA